MSTEITSVIDFHTHTFPEQIAKVAISKLQSVVNLVNYQDGTESDLIRSTRENQVQKSIVLPVATKKGQASGINLLNAQKNQNKDTTGLEFFAAIHPEDEGIADTLPKLKEAGFRGIKLHPVFQNARIDDPAYLRIIDLASELDLITVVHAGFDISFPGNDYAGVKNLLTMIDTLHPKKLVLAHMGGWGQWDLVEQDLAGADVYFDTSFSNVPFRAHKKEAKSTDISPLNNEQFLRIVRKHGADRILFGSDSPWSSIEESILAVKNCGLASSDVDKILYQNASKLLSILTH